MSSRTDQEIIGTVTAALVRDGRINLADIVHIGAENGIVRLSGTVRSAGEKDLAATIARAIPGVMSVENDLTVATEGEITDRELRAAIEDALAHDPALLRRVGCIVDDGIATLVGHITDAAQEQKAMQIAGSIAGIEQVMSALEIAGIVPDAALPPDDPTLLDALAQRLDCSGLVIRNRVLRVDHGVARLEGVVRTPAERERAGLAAAAVAGIRAVKNHLVIGMSEESRDPDEALLARVVHAIARDGRVSPTDVHVIVQGGIVTLTGAVDSIEDQNTLIPVVQKVPGVHRVDCQVVIQDRTSTHSDDKGVRGRPRPYRR
jgi:osmotically-inducible protein OsmY